MIKTNKKIKLYALLLLGITTLIVMIPVKETSAQFVIAWDYDSEKGTFDYDDYGQGFYMFVIQENGSSPSGSWTPVIGVQYFNESHSFNWTAGWGVRIDYYCWMNSTLTGASSLTDGQDYIRLNVTVTNAYSTQLDSQEDVSTFYQSSFWDSEMWLYGFRIILDILPTEGSVYTVTATYEVYW